MNIKKGDKVKILYGKDAGKTGVVLSVSDIAKKVIVSGINKFKKHIKGDGQSKKSEIIEIEKGVHFAKVMLVCPNCNKATRVRRERKGSGYVRFCKKCNKEFTMIKEEAKKEVKKVVKKEPVEKATKKVTKVVKKKVVKKEVKK